MKRIFVLLILLCSGIVAGQVVLKDNFGRNLSGKTITLVDWEGYMANPAIRLTLKPTVVPGTITIKANSPRIYFDNLKGTYNPNATPTKTINVSNTNVLELYLSIFPDRAAGNESYTLTVSSTNAADQSFPITVIDQDPASPVQDFNIKLDFSEDTRYSFYGNVANKAILQQAADDWAYFLKSNNFDQVPAGAQQTWIWNDDFAGGHYTVNSAAYTGFLLYTYGYDHSNNRSGGAPSNTNFQTRGGVSTPLRRSGSLEAEIHGNYNMLGWNTSITDDTWYLATNSSNVPNDLYSILMHEMGHALCFMSNHTKFGQYKTQGFIDDPEVVAYQKTTVPIDGSDHLSGGTYVTDRVSKRGAFGSEYASIMPNSRWLITKLNLLVLKSIGYNIKLTSAFKPVGITTNTLNNATVGNAYAHTVVANGGIPFYNFQIHAGSLPAGLSLNAFTGKISGTPTTAGSYSFTIRVTEYDGQTADKAFSITVSSGGNTAPSREASEVSLLEESSSVFPNPASTTVTIQATVASDRATITVLNALGEKLLNREVISTSGILNEELDILSYSPGIYQVCIDDGLRKVNRTFVKQ